MAREPAGGITAAARALALPKSAVSAAVSQLEAELGVRLLHRTPRAVTPTDAGRELHRRIAPALAAIDEASTAIGDMQRALSGVVRLSAPVEVGARLVEPVVTRFLAEHPDVRAEITLTARLVDLAEEGIDLAIRGGPVGDASLVARRLGREEAGLFASPSYLERRGRPRTIAELARHDAVVYRPLDGRGRWTMMGRRGAESVEVTARVGVDAFSYLVRAVVAGAGIALMPLFLCREEVERGALVRVLPSYVDRGTELHLVYPSGGHLPRRVAALRDALLAAWSTR
jgi:DNA-binding transcriptional LysR family regulator